MKECKKDSLDASITIFLSLVLLLILSLIMTVIEGARRTTAKVIAERTLYTSMDSVLAGFYGPLMEEYHLLGLYCPSEDATYGYKKRAEQMKEYMSYTLNPGQGVPKAAGRLNLYSTSLEAVELISGSSLVDHKGKILIHEITEYMKYKAVGDGAEFFLNKVSLLEQPKKVSVLYEEKAKLEEELVTIDEGILALMRYIDGISTGKKGILKGREGTIKTEDCFVKRILFGIPTMESTGINNEAVFCALESQYTDPSNTFCIIDNSFLRLDELALALEKLNADLELVQKEIEGAGNALDNLEASLVEADKEDEASIDTIKSKIHEAEEGILTLKDEADRLQDEIEVNQIEQMNCIDAIISNGNNLNQLVSGSLTAVEQAISELEQIIITAKKAKPLIKAYESNLDRKKEELDKEICESLEEGLNDLKRYDLDNSYGYDFPRMKEILDNNYNLLSLCMNSLNKGYEAMSAEDYIRARDAYREACQRIMTYETKGLNLNYSSLILEDEESPDFLGAMKELIKEGITGLVIDPKTISDNEISDERLPSAIDMLFEDRESFSFSDLLKNMRIGGKDTGISKLFGSFGDYSLGTLIGNMADEIAQDLLVQGYIYEHFNRFPVKDEEMKGRKPSVLTYEREYLLYANSNDKDNLEAVIGRLILLRTLLNFTSILGDKEKWNDAKLIASKLVGFTGLPILVAITQGVLMILLALASALVDTCALLIGNKIPILKKKVEEKYSDLLMLTRESIRKRATSYKDDKGFSYNDYLSLFLYLTSQSKLSYRMMDLIQENINMRYGTDISLRDCLFAYEAEAKFYIKPLFNNFLFMQKLINTSDDLALTIRAECSY